ncbi:MAG TPA: trypsin-like peptidase domain-containing protein, partial [Limnochordales bacterium]
MARPLFRLVACAALLVAVGAGAAIAADAGAAELEPAVVVNQRVMPAVVQIVTEIDYEVRRVAYVESRIQPGVFIREVGDWERHQARVAGSGTVVFSGTVTWGHEVRVMTLILTNHHVIEYALPERRAQVMKQYRPEDVVVRNWRQELAPGAQEVAEVRVLGARLGIVVLPDQNFWIPAHVEMYDANMDVALVRVDRVAGVPWVPLGDSDAVRVGETLFMAGAPLGLPFQLTSGRLGQKDLHL